MSEPPSPQLKGPESLIPKGETPKPQILCHLEDQGEPSAVVASLSPGAVLTKQDWENLLQDSEEPRPEEESPGPVIQQGSHQEASKTSQGLMEMQLETVQA